MRARVVLGALLAMLACGRGPRIDIDMPRITEAELAARAREDYRRACASCHGEDGRGTPESRAPDLTRLAERLGPEFSRRWIADVITGDRPLPAHGRREMPVWGIRFGRVESGAEAAAALWAERRLNALAAYVESLQRPARSGTDGRPGS